jgi:hypothetical protein
LRSLKWAAYAFLASVVGLAAAPWLAPILRVKADACRWDVPTARDLTYGLGWLGWTDPPPPTEPPLRIVDRRPGALVLGQSPEGDSSPLPTPKQPDQLIPSAVVALEGHETVSARIRQRIDLFDRQLTGSGAYLQGPWRHRLLRMELKMQIEDSLTSHLQVADGHHLWVHHQMVDSVNLGRVDLDRVAEKLAEGRGGAGEGTAIDTIGIGGLPRLLRAIDAAFTFTRVESKRVGVVPVWVVRGQWRPALLARLLPKQKAALDDGQPPDLSKLPLQVPDHVKVWLGQDDLFPYRIEYLRTDDKPSGSKESPGPPAVRPLVVMELFEVRLNAPIDSVQFVYNPGELAPSDATGQYLKMLGGTMRR